MNLSPLERETLALLPMTRQQLAARLDISNSAACQRVQSLAARGLVTGARGPVALTPNGETALYTCPPLPVALPAPLSDEALPPRVVVSGSALRVLRYLVDETSAGRRTTQKSIAADLRAPRSSITTLVRSLMAGGLVEADASLSTRHRRNVPTPLGIAVAAGRVPVVSRQLVQVEQRLARRIEPSAPKAVVRLSDRAAKLVSFLHAEAVLGRVPSKTAMVGALNTDRGSVHRYLEEAVRAGCLTWSTEPRPRALLTPLGVAVSDGTAATETARAALRRRAGRIGGTRAGQVRRRDATARAATPEATAPTATDGPRRSAEDVRAAVARVQVRPVPVSPPEPPPVAREPAPVDVGPPVPPGLNVNAPRPVRHPAPPAPAPRDPRISESRWRHLTTPKMSWTHNACAEGRA